MKTPKKESIKKNERKIEEVRFRYQSELEHIVKSNPNWKIDDARRWMISRITTILFITTLSLNLEADILTDYKFWEKYVNGNPKTLPKEGVIYFDRHIRASLVMEVVASLEHSFRIILTEMGHKLDRYDYSTTYKKIIKIAIPKSHRAVAAAPFELLRLIRNCHHNSWVYSPSKKEEPKVILSYRTHDFIFQEGEMPDFIGWELLTTIMDDILNVIILLLLDTDIAKKRYIKDPGAMEARQDI